VTAIGAAFEKVFPHAPVRFSAYDGSTAGDPDAPVAVRLENERGLRYVLTAPGSLGLGRAYVAGDVTVEGIEPGDPYQLLRIFEDEVRFQRPPLAEIPALARSLGIKSLRPPQPPPQEGLSPLRRLLTGVRHSKSRDAAAIHHHYDVSNRFYRMVLGPSMAYTCACYPTADATLEEAQQHKFDLVCRKLGLRPGMRLLDVGCGWGGMVRHAVTHYGVTAIGVTLSKNQASWASQQLADDGLADVAEVRFGDYRDVPETGFDAVSSIGLTEHIGVRNYPAYFRFLASKLRVGGRLLNHCITRADNRQPSMVRRGFINRYVFPDGELTGSGTIAVAMQDNGFEIRHGENLREHYARTLRDWCANLTANWDACVAEAGLPTAKVWGMYMAGSRAAFERDRIELHQLLGVKVGRDGNAHFPLRPDWGV
jgi:cyclopropane-fatty-acyl-phospholipid synthase